MFLKTGLTFQDSNDKQFGCIIINFILITQGRGHVFELLPPSGVFASQAAFNKADATKDGVRGARALFKSVFTAEELRTHSALGMRSVWPALDSHKLETVKSKHVTLFIDYFLNKLLYKYADMKLCSVKLHYRIYASMSSIPNVIVL